jgi:nitronate monooxygenase
MTLPDRITRRLRLPVVCAPMFLISTPKLVIAACAAGIIGALPRQNSRSPEEFEAALRIITDSLDAVRGKGGVPGPLAVNIPTTLSRDEMAADLDRCARYGVEIVITSVGDPRVVTELAHERGLLVHHDATSLRFAEKAIAAGVDGLNCIGAGGGGHSGTISHLALIPRVRAMFDGTVSLAGAVANGAAVRAAEILGADLAFVGTRFAATAESGAHPLQKEWMVSGDSRSLRYTDRVNGVPANWLVPSLERHGLSVDEMPAPVRRGTGHLPEGVAPWRDLWSAGQSIELIEDIPRADALIRRLAAEYIAACATPDHVVRARSLLEGAPAADAEEVQLDAAAR